MSTSKKTTSASMPSNGTIANPWATPARPDTSAPTTARPLTEPTPNIAHLVQICACVEIGLGVVLTLVLLASDIPWAGLIALLALATAAFSGILLFALAALLTWVYQIKLNTTP